MLRDNWHEKGRSHGHHAAIYRDRFVSGHRIRGLRILAVSMASYHRVDDRRPDLRRGHHRRHRPNEKGGATPVDKGDFMKKGQNFNHPPKGSSIKVDPIKSTKHIKNIKKLLADKPLDYALFVSPPIHCM